MSPSYVLADVPSNTEAAEVDGITLQKGDVNPVELSKAQVARCERSGIKLQEASSPQEAVGQLTGRELDKALTDAGITVESGASADDKRKALADHVSASK